MQAAAWLSLAADVQLGISYHLQNIVFFKSTVGLGPHLSWLECPLIFCVFMEKVCLNSSLCMCVRVWLNGSLRVCVCEGGRGVVVEGTAVTESLHK